MPRKYFYDEKITELKERVEKSENDLKEYIKAQRTRDTSIFLALVSAVISAVAKAMFTG